MRIKLDVHSGRNWREEDGHARRTKHKKTGGGEDGRNFLFKRKLLLSSHPPC